MSDRNMYLYIFYPKDLPSSQRIHANATLIIKAEGFNLVKRMFVQVIQKPINDFTVPIVTATFQNPFTQFILPYSVAQSKQPHAFSFRSIDDGKLMFITSASSLFDAYKSLRYLFIKQMREGLHVTINNKYTMMVQLGTIGNTNQLLPIPDAFLLSRKDFIASCS